MEDNNKSEKKEKSKENKNEIKQKVEENVADNYEKLINYKYNEKGELVNKKTLKKVEKLDKQEYELVGIYVQHYVENYLIKKFNLKTLYVPNFDINADYYKRDDTKAQCKILITKDFPTNPKCLMIIQGTGPAKLGQWARSTCINENLKIGSMASYIENAIKYKFSVIIFNPNERYDFFYEHHKIEEFDSMINHCLYVYSNIVKKNNNINEIYIVAHSKGGECAIAILLEFIEDLLYGKIKKIAFTDSAHGNSYKKLEMEGLKIFRQISRNYVCSKKPAGTFISGYENAKKGVNSYSSGSNIHENTSGYAVSEIFKFFTSGENKNKNKSKSTMKFTKRK